MIDQTDKKWQFCAESWSAYKSNFQASNHSPSPRSKAIYTLPNIDTLSNKKSYEMQVEFGTLCEIKRTGHNTNVQHFKNHFFPHANLKIIWIMRSIASNLPIIVKLIIHLTSDCLFSMGSCTRQRSPSSVQRVRTILS